MTEPELSPEDAVLAEAMAVLDGAAAMFSSKQSQMELLDEELGKVRAQYDAMRAAKVKLETESREYRQSIRRAEFNLETAARAKNLADERARLMLEQAARQAELDLETANATWRARAMPHQIEGARFIASAKRVICADAMGLGKTFQSGIALDMLKAKRVLIITQSDIQSGFEREYETYLPDRATVVVGQMSRAQKRTILEGLRDFADQFVVIINYESWSRDKSLTKLLAEMRFDTVILDEAHNIKDMNTSAYKGCEEIIFATNICPVDGCLLPKVAGAYTCAAGHEDTVRGKSVVNVIPMTGTPILNRPDDIYSMLYLIRPELFPSRRDFIYDFCKTNGSGKIVFQVDGQARLSKKLGGLYFRRTRETAGVVLPPQEIIVHMIEQDAIVYDRQAAMLTMLKERAQIEINESGDKMTMVGALALITRQRQAATWPGGIKFHEPICDEDGYMLASDGAYYCDKADMKEHDVKQVFNVIEVGLAYQESQKLDKAVELIRELEEDGRRVVVFSQFRTTLVEMGKRLGSSAVEFHGGVSRDTRDAVKRNFDAAYGEAPRWNTVLAHYAVGGVGTNFTNASALVVLDEEWNPGKNNQAYDRINRIGQKRDTQVHILRLAESMDEWMAELVSQKANEINGFDAANADQGSLTEKLLKIIQKDLEG